jgi:membrane protease YdiL (CAAX protease family)
MFKRKSTIRREQVHKTKIYTSELTAITWILGISAFFLSLLLGLTYVFSSSSDEQLFGFTTLLEATFSLAGILFIDPLNDKPLKLKPEEFKNADPNTLLHLTIIFMYLLLVQFASQFPITVKDWHRGLAMWFAGVSEELFFRGFILQLFISFSNRIGAKEHTLSFSNPFNKKKNVEIISLSSIEFIGLIVSTVSFTFLHYNYYGNPLLLVIVSLSGLGLGLAYIRYKDLTANILAHMMLNVIVTFNIFGVLNF